ncbi:hypothetical protein SDC9_103792 [bioreactor metagenome]|uniref:Uncharacterized protein n=1 Tax=bioreactor metagenome TaxID=1076179 RepID=A0A645AUP5_9ZZZZ
MYLRCGVLLGGVRNQQHRISRRQRGKRRERLGGIQRSHSGRIHQAQSALEELAWQRDLGGHNMPLVSRIPLLRNILGKIVDLNGLFDDLHGFWLGLVGASDHPRCRLCTVADRGRHAGRDIIVDRAHRCVHQRIDQLALALFELSDNDDPHVRILESGASLNQPLHKICPAGDRGESAGALHEFEQLAPPRNSRLSRGLRGISDGRRAGHRPPRHRSRSVRMRAACPSLIGHACSSQSVLYVTQSNDAEHPQARPPGKPGCECHLVRSEIDLALATGGAGAWAEDIAAVGPLEAVLVGSIDLAGERILDCERVFDINIHVRRLIIERIVDVKIEVVLLGEIVERIVDAHIDVGVADIDIVSEDLRHGIVDVHIATRGDRIVTEGDTCALPENLHDVGIAEAVTCRDDLVDRLIELQRARIYVNVDLGIAAAEALACSSEKSATGQSTEIQVLEAGVVLAHSDS